MLALLVLNALLSFSAWWPTPGVLPDARIAPEFVWLWVVLLALVAWRGVLSRRSLALLTASYLLLILGRYIDVTVPSMFGRPVNLFWDIPQIPRPLWVWAQSAPWWLVLSVVLALALLAAALWHIVRWCISVAARSAAPYALHKPWAWGATAACVVLVMANHAGVKATWPVVSKPVVPTYWRQAQILAAAFISERQDAVLPPSTALDTARALPRDQALRSLNQRDVVVMMLESYGVVTYDDARARPTMQRARQQFAAALQAGGRHVATAFVRSPTFAGASDLAQLSTLSGIDLSDPMRHDVLLTTQRPTLLSLFREHGYQTFGVYPALSWAWPEARFFNYDVFIDGRTLAYEGPKLGYWQVPDAFTMAKVEAMHPRTADAPPRFMFFPTITTHLPFSPVPPQQPDWQRLLGPQPFDDADVQRALAKAPNWLDMFPDYLQMMDYMYTWLGHWMRGPEPRDTVYVLVGDHQPAANVTGEDASWDVPVHVVTRDPALLARFIAQGFKPGLEPVDSGSRGSLGGMHELTGIVLRAFSGASDAVLAGMQPVGTDAAQQIPMNPTQSSHTRSSHTRSPNTQLSTTQTQ